MKLLLLWCISPVCFRGGVHRLATFPKNLMQNGLNGVQLNLNGLQLLFEPTHLTLKVALMIDEVVQNGLVSGVGGRVWLTHPKMATGSRKCSTLQMKIQSKKCSRAKNTKLAGKLLPEQWGLKLQ